MKDEDIFSDANKAMVIAIAREQIIPNGCSVTLEDLIQAGYEGLLIASKRYKDTGKAKFSTYARYVVRGKIINEIQRDGAIIKGKDKDGHMPHLDYLEDIDEQECIQAKELLDFIALENVFEFVSDDLSDLERVCIALRLGIGAEKHSLRSIERKLHISRYYVTNYIRTGMKKLEERGIA